MAFSSRPSSSPSKVGLSQAIPVCSSNYSKSLQRPPIQKKAMKRAQAVKNSKPRRGDTAVGEALQTVIPAGFAFVMKYGATLDKAEWRYVTFEYGNCLGVSPLPFTVFKEITNDLNRFWRRVVIDGAFRMNEGYMWPKTMKLVEVHMSAKDATGRLFGDDDMHSDAIRLGALAKLAPQEAKLLGLETDYTMLRIVQGMPNDADDERMADHLRNNLEALGLDRVD